MTAYKPLENYIESLAITDISKERKVVLEKLLQYLSAQKETGKTVALNFICTHNSRRSHLAQVWAQTMAQYYQHHAFYCFSGGTEATALYPQVAATLSSVGFKTEQLRNGENPIYQIKYAEAAMPIIGFSKKHDASFNPSSAFAAIMVCDAAAEACPYVSGADMVMSLTYKDPKLADGRSDKATHYEERSKQIAIEMKWVFSQL
jgi:arsenate reductase